MERMTVARAQRTPTRSDPAHRHPTRPRSTPHPIEALQRSIGNQAVQRLFNSPFIHAGLFRQAGDELEQELEQVAESATHGKCPECERGLGHCPKCAGDEGAAVPAQQAPPPPPPPPTYAFISRGSYGQTAPGFTRPSCAAAAAPAVTSTLVAGSAAPVITVFPTGRYSVMRNDGVAQTATCTRLAAGLAATTAHENSHANGARAAVTAANTAAGLPQNHATGALCAAALPVVLTAWNTSVNAAWTNEVNHGPGTNPPTAQTFTQEHAAGTCTFV